MRNNFIYILLFFLLNITGVHCENMYYRPKILSLDKDKELSIFKMKLQLKQRKKQ